VELRASKRNVLGVEGQILTRMTSNIIDSRDDKDSLDNRIHQNPINSKFFPK
ncbi:MAG: hypothetical protein MHPSP_003635, partial [Paramarteilia canceri]